MGISLDAHVAAWPWLLGLPWCLLLCAVALALFGFAPIALGEGGQVAHWPAPEGIAQSPDTQVIVGGEPLFVYETAVNNRRSFTEYPALDSTPVALFDFTGEVTIEIRRPGVKSATIRPLSLRIQSEVSEGIIRFTLESPQHLTIEFDGETRRALHLFAGAPMEAPNMEDETILYFGPGVHTLPLVRLRSGQSVYLAGGAVLRSKIVADKAENIRIFGRGIIDGSIYDRWTQRMVPIDLNLCKDVVIEGITILDPAGWTVNTFACDGVIVRDVKIISARPNGDGLTAQSCQNYLAEHCFVRSWDDSLVVKNYGNGISHDITFRDIQIWTDLAQSCEIGYETRGPEIYNITFEDITVLHNFHKPVLSIHNSDHAYIHDILYRNITIEDAQMGEGDGAHENFLIHQTIAESQWTQSEKRGTIGNIRYENITVLGGKVPPSHLVGYDSDHGIAGVAIENLVIHGEKITTLQAGDIRIGPHVTDVTIK